MPKIQEIIVEPSKIITGSTFKVKIKIEEEKNTLEQNRILYK